MKTVPLAEARQNFSQLISEVEAFDEHVVITKNGKPAAVIISADEWEEIDETAFWRAQPGIMEDIAEADAAIAAGDTISIEEYMRERGLTR